MLTIFGAPPVAPVLVGVMRMHRRGAIPTRPYLHLDVFCPWCRRLHGVGFPDPPWPMETVVPLDMPCASGPWKGIEVYAGPDPDRRDETAKLVEHFRQALRRWESERRFAWESSERRARVRAGMLAWANVPEIPDADVA